MAEAVKTEACQGSQRHTDYPLYGGHYKGAELSDKRQADDFSEHDIANSPEVAACTMVEKLVNTQKEILTWLQANLGRHCTAPLTSTDCYALVTSVNLCNLIGYSSAPPELFAAYGAIVRQMQPHTRGLAYHAIACELDWPHRDVIWKFAGLPVGDKLAFKCAFES